MNLNFILGPKTQQEIASPQQEIQKQWKMHD